MTAFTGEIFTAPALVFSTQDGYGESISYVQQVVGNQDGYGSPKFTALASSGINPIPHYKLSCEDNTGLRHYWVDTSISLINAPAGFTYVISTFVNQGKF
jgi:hypothetical protein